MINELQGFLDSFGADYFGTGKWQKFHDWLEKQKESLHAHETCKENTDSFTSLEEAAQEYAIPFNDTTYGCEYSYKGFIAGAKWMESKMTLPADTVIFMKGVAEGRRLEREEVPRWKKGPADSAIRTRDYWPVSNAPVLGKPETRDYLIVKRGKSLLLAFHAEEGDYYLSTEELDKIPTE